jgi:asparagine synthase (glutamine-hydrolysing)
MCGIAGYIDFKNKTDPFVLKNMIEALRHRGPDFISHEVISIPSAQLGLAHARLSIIDLSDRANQPMHNESFVVVFNGEIYNYLEIKKLLINEGIEFNTDSDTEVLLAAFRVWGYDCVKRFIGMFAFVIYDKLNNKLVLCRDRAGVKPLFYYYSENVFLFASEIKSFHWHPAFLKEINSDSVFNFIQFGFIPGENSIFNQVFKIKPGTLLEVDLNTKDISENFYWNVEDCYLKPKLEISFEDALIQTENLLDSAFKYRLVSDVPVGVFLSGGFDSTLLAGILQKNSPTKINTYTIGVPDKNYNEAPTAKTTAEILGTNHQELFCTENEFLKLVSKLPEIFDEPFADSSAIPTLMVSSMASSHVKVALSADGGDEIFAGYNRYDYLKKYWKIFSNPESLLFKTSKFLFCNDFAEQCVPAKHLNTFHKLCSVLENPTLTNFIHNLNIGFTDKDMTLLLGDGNRNSFNYQKLLQKADAKTMSDLSFMMMLDYKLYLTDDIMCKIDRCSMAFGLEAREPYLDHRIIEWAAVLPDEFKIKDGVKKFILKELTYKYIPKKHIDLPKSGFSIPLNKWLKSELKEFVYSYLNEQSLMRHNYFNVDYVIKLRDRFYDKNETWLGLRIWNLLCFQMWYQRWF